MVDREFLAAMPDMMDEKLNRAFDEKLEPINSRLKKIEMTQENEILPRLQTIEECYISIYERYKKVWMIMKI